MRRKRRNYHRKKTEPRPISVPVKPPNSRRLAPYVEACIYAGVSRWTMWRLVNQKKITAYKYSNRTMVDLDTVDAWHKSLPELNHA